MSRTNLFVTSIACLLPLVGQAGEVTAGGPVLGSELRLKTYLQSVLAHNESIQAQMLGTESDRLKLAAELGIFEPNLIGSASRVSNHRQNNNEQAAGLNGSPEFKERNNLYDTALESLLPTGGKIRLGYTMSDLGNNQAHGATVNGPFGPISGPAYYDNQWQDFMGVTLTQPLLKNGGIDATFAKIRLAAVQSDIGFQQYRRQLMLTVSQAEAAYWALYFAQEQLQFVNESLQVAQTVLGDSKARLKAGKGTELDVLEADSGVALRQTKKNEALQHYYDAVSQISVLCGATPQQGNLEVKAVDLPDCAEVPLSYPASCASSFEFNPDYLIQRQHVNEENIRVGVARNQALPEVNAKGAYGVNGLGQVPYQSSPHGAWEATRSENFPAWSIGLEVHVPLFGGITGRNTLGAAKLTQKQAQLNLQGVGTQLTNAVSNSIQKNRTILGTVHDYETVVRFREDLVKTELARLESGKVEAYRVLEVEAQLFEARQSLAESQVQYQRSLLELQLAEGSILKKRNLELTRKELRQKTVTMIKNRDLAIDGPAPVIKKGQPTSKK